MICMFVTLKVKKKGVTESAREMYKERQVERKMFLINLKKNGANKGLTYSRNPCHHMFRPQI